MSALPLVFLPGMMCDARVFVPQIGALSRRHAIHIGNITAHDSIEELARSVLVTAPLRFALAGHAMGGMVAMAMLLQAPERIRCLALMDSDARADSARTAGRRGRQMARVEAGVLESVMRDEVLPECLGGDPADTRFGTLCMEMARDLGAQVFLRQSAALRDRPDLREVLERSAVPTLVLCGESDALFPVEVHRRMQERIAGARLAVIPGAGHLPTLEAPEATTRALEAWLAA